MNDEPFPNPYESPASDSNKTVRPVRRRVPYLLWAWLSVSVLTSLLATPADPVSALLCLIMAHGFFCVGAVAASPLHFIARILVFAAWLVPGILIISELYTGHAWPYVLFTLMQLGCAFMSIYAGFVVFRGIPRGGLRILLAFSCGYWCGAIVLGWLGALAGSFAAVQLALLSLPKELEATG